MIDHFHCTYKAALMSWCKEQIWFTQLPWVVLRLRTIPKDARISRKLKWYMGTVGYPSQIFSLCNLLRQSPAPTSLMEKFSPCCQTCEPPAKATKTNKSALAMDVFLCNDTNRHPANGHFHGPLPVIRHTPKAFNINIRDREVLVSLICPKPPYLLSDDLPIIHLSQK
ncbi:uncharacterized protein [Palaemon carinicauda]|uniref:uncharacterized protein n=1 Tax=Palaemon carinicauda TaxID=392227 RepID=UPI0035B5901B